MIALLILINSLRVHPLADSPLLDRRAKERAEYLCANHQWSHDGWYYSFRDTGYKYAGENLARYYPTDTATFQALSASPSHLANMQDPHFKKFGAGKSCGITVMLFQG